MSLLDRFFKPAHQRALDAAQTAVDRGRWADAWRELEGVEVPAELRERAEALRARAAGELCDTLMGDARAAVRRNEQGVALELVDAARPYALLIGRVDELEQLARDAQSRRAASAAVELVAPRVGPRRQRLDLAELLGAFPDAIADRYEAVGRDFCEAVIDAHEDPASAVERLRAVAEKLDRNGVVEPLVRFELGRALRALDRNDEAADALLAAASATRGVLTDMRLAAAEALWAVERWSDAEPLLQAAVDEHPEDLEVWVGVVNHCGFTRDTEGGLDAVDEALRRWPNDLRLRTMRARLTELAGRDDEAIAAYEAIVQQTWDWNNETGQLRFHADSALYTATFHVRTNRRPERALELLRALSLATDGPLRARCELDRALVALRNNRPEEGQRLLAALVASSLVDDRITFVGAAQLSGNKDAFDAALADLDPRERARWARICSDRGTDPAALAP